MYTQSQSSGALTGRALSPSSANVLRNTYALLGLSLLPTIAGAFVGVQFGLMNLMPTGFIGALVLIAVMMGFMYAIHKNADSGLGVGLLLSFTFFMGIMLSGLIARTLAYSNGPSLIMHAAGGTAIVFFAMSALAQTIKRDLSFMGKFLFVGMIMLLVAGLMNIFLQSSALMIALSVISIGLFSAYMLYDIKQVIDGGEDNYIRATLSLYISMFAIFQNLLQLLGIFGGEE